MNKTALILGVSGQDGAYLSRLLLEKGYTVVGTSRDALVGSFKNLRRLGIFERVQLESVALNDFRSVLQALFKVKPDEIYNLAGQSSVGLSYQQPVESLESISIGTLNLLEAIRFTAMPVRFYNAGSSECFGNIETVADETTPFRPRSPYAVAKASAYWQVATYREAYNLFCCTGILFNHESPLRPERFVTQKIVSSACRIAGGSNEKLRLGNLVVQRDWGWAPEYVEAMWLMLQQPTPDDYVIATGETNSLEVFVEAVFLEVGLDWREYVVSDQSFFRPSDITLSQGNPERARQRLGWQAKFRMRDIIREMVRTERALLAKATSGAAHGLLNR